MQQRWVGMMQRLRARTSKLKIDAHATYLATRDARTPWYARWLALAVAAYAFSPIDLIPDVIPIIGYLDDLVLVPAGIALVVRLIPDDVWIDSRRRAQQDGERVSGLGIAGAAIVVLIWMGVVLLAGYLITRRTWGYR